MADMNFDRGVDVVKSKVLEVLLTFAFALAKQCCIESEEIPDYDAKVGKIRSVGNCIMDPFYLTL